MRQATHRTHTPSLGWVWLLSGIVIGIVGVIIIHSGMNNPNTIDKIKTLALSRVQTQQPPIKPKNPHAQTAPVDPVKESKKYEFYTLLPGMEVQLPPMASPQTPPLTSSPVVSAPMLKPAPLKPSIAAVMPKKPENPKPAPVKVAPTPIASNPIPQPAGPTVQSKLAAAHYIIQAGVFALPADAKELANRMGTKGFKPQVHTLKMRNGVTAYRVILGPYPTEVMATNQKKQLEQHKIHGILILKR
jgi:cell division protein FtsN